MRQARVEARRHFPQLEEFHRPLVSTVHHRENRGASSRNLEQRDPMGTFIRGRVLWQSLRLPVLDKFQTPR